MDKVKNELKVDISVVIPVFNVEKYLTRCLDSVFGQKFSGTYQVIAVEDASTDNSLQLLKSYQAKEPRLVIIEHGINRKLSVARATGVKASTGDYIMHVDSDDWLLPDAFETLHQSCIDTKADVVVFGTVRQDTEGKIVPNRNITRHYVTTDKLKVQRYFFGAPWNKIVKRALAENMISGEVGVNNTEDLLYATEILLRAESICLLPANCYVYVENRDSLSSVVGAHELIRRQVPISHQLQRIIDAYKPDIQCTENILNYYEKAIYHEFANIRLLNAGDLESCRQSITDISLVSIMTDSRVTHLRRALNSDFWCLVEVANRYSFKEAAGFMLKSLRRKRAIVKSGNAT